jgi:hypothetical protein
MIGHLASGLSDAVHQLRRPDRRWHDVERLVASFMPSVVP